MASAQVRTTAELEAKMTSFAHARDVKPNWLETVWNAWDRNQTLEDLHPTHPAAFKRTAPQPLWKLPPALRRLALRGGDDEALYGTAADGNPPFLDLGLEKPEDASADRVAAPPLPVPNATAPNLAWRTLDALGRFESVLSADEVARLEKKQLDPTPAAPLCDAAGAPRFLVLVLGEGELDDVSMGVFEDAANAVAAGLLELGAAAAPVVYCADARLCAAPRDAPFFTVVLGPRAASRTRRAPGRASPRPTTLGSSDSAALGRPRRRGHGSRIV